MHNILQLINVHWDDERLYQEARRIVIAQLQVITFREYLPAMIGWYSRTFSHNIFAAGMQNMQSYGLELLNNGYYTDYNLDIDPSILNEYAAAVGQYFFTQMGEQIRFPGKDRSQADIDQV